MKVTAVRVWRTRLKAMKEGAAHRVPPIEVTTHQGAAGAGERRAHERVPAAASNAAFRSLIKNNLLTGINTPQQHVGLGWRQDEDGTSILARITDAGAGEPDRPGTKGSVPETASMMARAVEPASRTANWDIDKTRRRLVDVTEAQLATCTDCGNHPPAEVMSAWRCGMESGPETAAFRADWRGVTPHVTFKAGRANGVDGCATRPA